MKRKITLLLLTIYFGLVGYGQSKKDSVVEVLRINRETHTSAVGIGKQIDFTKIYTDTVSGKWDSNFLYIIGSPTTNSPGVVEWGGTGMVNTTIIPKYDTVKVLMLYCDTTYRQYDNVYWRIGYEVLRLSDFIELPKHIAYLDRNKIPLSNYIIVWQTKQINK